jgi:Cu2+-exporting ATPase
MCCIGCEAVAQSIVDNGLVDYYRHRDAMPETRREAMPVELQELGLFDHPDFQKSFVRPVGEHEREAALILEGITCAACVWLNENHVARLPGVSAIEINYATRRARVRWDERQIKLSDILAAIQAIGYRAYPYDAERSEQVAHRERRSMLWRVFVAGFGMMQVMMYAFPVYVAGEGDMTWDIEQLLRWASLLLTLLILLHKGRGGGLSDMFGGGLTQNAGSSGVAEKNLNRWTVIIALLWVAIIIALGLMTKFNLI